MKPASREAPHPVVVRYFACATHWLNLGLGCSFLHPAAAEPPSAQRRRRRFQHLNADFFSESRRPYPFARQPQCPLTRFRNAHLIPLFRVRLKKYRIKESAFTIVKTC
jgi:hypothetical protein